jgi:hypothetical protein
LFAQGSACAWPAVFFRATTFSKKKQKEKTEKTKRKTKNKKQKTTKNKEKTANKNKKQKAKYKLKTRNKKTENKKQKTKNGSPNNHTFFLLFVGFSVVGESRVQVRKIFFLHNNKKARLSVRLAACVIS